MSLKSIRESYSKFLTTLTDAGVKLNESQKANLDGFILAIESKMAKQKETAIRATKKVVSEHLEAEYQKVFESIMKHQQQNAELASKIQSKITSINESKKIARKVDNYLDLYVESVLPKKAVVDYDRLQKLEQIHESLKDILVCNEDAVETKKAALQESFSKDKKAYETQIAKLQVKLNESMEKATKLNRKIDSFKALELLESKTADLPDYEARQMKKRFANATTTEINAKFDMVLESVKDEMKVDEKEEEASIEEEVKDIIECDGKEADVKENDILKGRKHNAHIDEAEKIHPVTNEEHVMDWLEDDGYDGLPLKPFLYPTPAMKRLLKTLSFKLVGNYNGMPEVEVFGSDEDVNWWLNATTEIGAEQKYPRYKQIIDLAMRGDKTSVFEKEEDFETIETVKEDEDGEVELDDAEKVDESLMKMYCKDFKRFF